MFEFEKSFVGSADESLFCCRESKKIKLHPMSLVLSPAALTLLAIKSNRMFYKVEEFYLLLNSKKKVGIKNAQKIQNM